MENENQTDNLVARNGQTNSSLFRPPQARSLNDEDLNLVSKMVDPIKFGRSDQDQIDDEDDILLRF